MPRELFLPWEAQPQETAEVNWDNPITRDLVDSFDLRGRPRSLVLGTPASVSGSTAPITGVPTTRGLGFQTAPSTGVFYFERGDSKYCPPEQTHVALLSIDSISGGGFDNVFSTADIPTFGSTGPYFASTTYLGTDAGVWSPATMYQDGLGVFVLSIGAGGKSVWWKGIKRVSAAGGTLASYSTSRMIFNQARQLGTSALTRGSYVLHHLFKRGMADEEIRSISDDPLQVWRPRWMTLPSGIVIPTLSLPTYTPGSLTSTGFRPRVTAT